MFAGFFLELRDAKVPVSLREYLTLMEAMREGVADYDIDDFYYLSRATLVKDERHLDRSTASSASASRASKPRPTR